MITASLDNQSETAELYPQGTERYVRNPQFHFTQQTRENRTTVVASSPETTVLLEGPEAEFIAEVDGKTLEDMMRLPRWAADLPLMFALAAQLVPEFLSLSLPRLKTAYGLLMGTRFLA